MKLSDKLQVENFVNFQEETNKLEREAKPLWTVDEVADLLRLQPSTVRAMCRRGDIRAVKVGKVWRFHENQIRDFLANE